MANRNMVLQLIITLRDQAREGVDRIRTGLQGIGDAASGALAPLRTFWGLVGAGLGIAGARELVQQADAYTRLSNSLKVATKSQQEFQAAEQTVVRIAAETRSALETTAQLYARIHQNRKAMNVSERETADLTELISKGMQLGGASAKEYASATLQLTQAFGSGMLRGEEFNAVMEASPELMRRLADGLDVAVGELRGMAEQGVLTSTTVAKALLSQKDAIDEAYNKTIATVEQRFEQLQNASILFVGKLNEQTGATRAAGAGLKFMAENLDLVASILGTAVAASLAKFTQSAAQSVQASLAARQAARDHALAEAARQQSILGAAQAQVAAAQAAYNRALAEQRLAQQIVTAMQAELGYGVTEAELAAARMRGATAAQAATAATRRYTAAQAALAALQGPAAASAGLFSRALGFLTGPGGLILMAVSAFGLLYSAFSKQKPVTDELAQSTEQYAESLKKMGAAQAKVELNRVNDALIEQRQRVQEAQQAYQQAANTERDWILITEDRGGILGKTTRIVSDASEIERLRAERLAQVETETQKLAVMEERRAAITEEVGKKEAVVGQEALKNIMAQQQMQLLMGKYSQQTEKVGEAQGKVSAANQNRIESEIALAKAAEDVQRLEQLGIELARAKAETAQSQAKLDQDIALAAKMKLAAMEAEYRNYQTLTPIQRQAREDAKADEKIKNAQAQASQALAKSLQEQADRTATLHPAQAALLAGSTQLREAQEEVAASSVKAAQAALELARARGDERAIAESLLALKRAEAAESKATMVVQQAELEQLKQKRQQLIESAGGYEKLTAMQRLEVAQLDQNINSKNLDIAASEKEIETKEREARQAEIMAGPIGQLTRLYKEQSEEHQRAAAASERYYDTQVQEIDGAIRVAQARGDEAQAAKLQAQQQKILLEQADALAQARAVEAADAAKAVDAKRLELAADGELSKADQEQIQHLQDIAAAKATAAEQAINHANAMEDEAKAAKGVVEGMDLFTDSAARNAQLTKQLDAEAQAFRETWKEVNTALATFRGETAIAFGLQGIGRFNDLTRQIKDAIEQAGIAAQDLTENGLRGNVTHAEHLAEELEASNSYLNQAAHGAAQALRQALADAREEAEAMTRSLAEAAQATELEILRLQGRKDEILEREHQDKLKKLQEYYDKAGQRGEDEFRKAVERENELYRLKQKQLDEEDRNPTPRDRPATASGGGSTTTTTSSRSGGAATFSPSFHFPNAIVVDRRAVEELTRQHILPVLKDIERRTR